MSKQFWNAAHCRDVKRGTEAIIDMMRFCQLRSDNELIIEEVSTKLKENKIPFQTNYYLNDSDYLDIMIDGIGIKAMIGYTEKIVIGMVRSICDSDKVQTIIVATDIKSELPDTVYGKKVFKYSIGQLAF